MYANNTAIANRYSIMYKMKFGSECESTEFGKYGFNNYYFNSAYNIVEIGAYYYTTNPSNKTYLPAEEAICNGTTVQVSLTLWEGDNYMLKGRKVPSAPIYFLIKGLSANTTYHVGGYYKLSGGTYGHFGEVTATTSAPTQNAVLFNTTRIGSSVPSSAQERATALANLLEEEFRVVEDMFADATDENETYTPYVEYSTSNWAAEGPSRYNCHADFEHENIRSLIVHELGHSHFFDYIGNGEDFSTNVKAIKFMEFATDVELATWGEISGHYYPIISSARYDMIDDYLVVMSMNLSNLYNS